MSGYTDILPSSSAGRQNDWIHYLWRLLEIVYVELSKLFQLLAIAFNWNSVEINNESEECAFAERRGAERAWIPSLRGRARRADKEKSPAGGFFRFRKSSIPSIH